MAVIDVENLKIAFAEKRAALGIAGMGYVGLSLMLAATGLGCEVISLNIDEPKVEGGDSGAKAP